MNTAGRMGRWSARHRAIAFFGWLAFVAVATFVGTAVGTKTITDAENGNGDTARAARAIDASGLSQPASEDVLVQTRNGKPDVTALRAGVRDVVHAVTATGAVSDVHSALDGDPAAFVSRDGHSMLVQFDVVGPADTASSRIQPVLDAVASAQRAHPSLRIEEVGDASATKALNNTLGRDFRRAELLSVPLTLGILLAAFGAVVAAIVPVGLALTAFLAAGGLVALASRAVHVDGTADSVMLLVGLAVGVDYSLFYLKREREERARGRGPEHALAVAAATSGRSVLVSGLTVVVALAGLFFTGQAVFKGIAAATVIVVAIAVVGSVTVLPAIMSMLGDRIEKGRIPFVRRLSRRTAEADGSSRVWHAILRPVIRRPGVAATLAGALLVALALPVLGMKTALPGTSDLPRSLPIVATYDRLNAAFPGGPQPALVVITADDVNAPAVQEAIAGMSARAQATGVMSAALPSRVSAAGTVELVPIPLAGDGANAVSGHALSLLRNEVIPQTIGRLPGVHAYVTGETAGSHDFSAQLRARAPLVFAFVLGLALVLLLVAFRSVTIALTAIALNLLSLGASYGAMVLVFQHHWFDGILGYTSTGSITTWIPLFMFAILFGLSMDYHVFVLSRIVENRRRGLPTVVAVERGIVASAGVISSAAVIMVAVFSIFGTLSQVEMKQVGIGLAVAVLLDATVVRAVLLPAVMVVLGERNWYLPRWLRWLPAAAVHDGDDERLLAELERERAREPVPIG
jgi:putative drug exporter of the RND superfamily